MHPLQYVESQHVGAQAMNEQQMWEWVESGQWVAVEGGSVDWSAIQSLPCVRDGVERGSWHGLYYQANPDGTEPTKEHCL
jgi:hypothetical protein